MALKFRNLTVSPQDPVEQWGVEGLLAAVERGDINDLRRIARALRTDPHGKVAQQLSEVAAAAENPAVPTLLQRIHRQALTGKTAPKP
ncbi:hypothetical protein ACFVRT_15955 [Arthrobacter koreensis]|uniref:hypothetical protein n=1 Tax=Arthrobacter koreensis TaxID=199136 RepID=UPI0036DD1D7B